MSPYGNFNLARQELKNVALKTLVPNKIPSRNAKIQIIIAKHVFECFEKRKEKDSKKDIPLELNTPPPMLI